MRLVTFAIALSLLAPTAALARPHPAPGHAPLPDLIIDEDGALDDLAALALVMASGKVRVRAITVCPADSYLEPATRATQLFVDRLGGRGVTIAKGHAEGDNPFPPDWRKDAELVLGVPALKDARATGANRVVGEDAAHHLVRLLSGSRSYVILETGPLTNIAEALRLRPSIRRRISRIWVMGGAVRVGGNVEQKGHDGSAEWNIFNQPRAADAVLRSGVPITLIPLDATNRAPLKPGFVDRLAQRRSPAAQLASQTLRLAVTRWPDDYYFWDPLAAAALLDPGVVRFERLKLKVITMGPSQGRIVEAADGVAVDVATDADRAKVEALFLDVFGR